MNTAAIVAALIALQGCSDAATAEAPAPADGPGTIALGSAPIGESCTTGDECASGACSDYICCDRACDGACEICLAGQCQVRKLDTAARDGCPLSGNCDGVSSGCTDHCSRASRCVMSDANCIDEHCVVPQPLGESCTANEGCGSNNCLDGLCCPDRGTCEFECTSDGRDRVNPYTGEVIACANATCRDGKCLGQDGCTTNAGCPEGQACLGGQCTAPPSAPWDEGTPQGGPCAVRSPGGPDGRNTALLLLLFAAGVGVVRRRR